MYLEILNGIQYQEIIPEICGAVSCHAGILGVVRNVILFSSSNYYIHYGSFNEGVYLA